MDQQETIHYHRIAQAIDYIKQHYKAQPNLDEMAENIHLSPFHFQRLFTNWAGVSCKAPNFSDRSQEENVDVIFLPMLMSYPKGAF